MANGVKTPVVAPKSEMPAYVAEDADFQGRWTGDELVVQGRIDGQLSLAGWLRIGRSGRVEGSVRARSVEVGGAFAGEIRAQLIVFGETAHAEGTFVSERLIIKEGAVIDGSFEEPPAPAVQPLPARPAAAAPPPPPAVAPVGAPVVAKVPDQPPGAPPAPPSGTPPDKVQAGPLDGPSAETALEADKSPEPPEEDDPDSE